MRQVTHNEVQTSTTIITTSTGTAVDVRRAKVFSCQVLPVDATMAAQTFASTAVDVTANTMTTAANGYVTGLKGQFTTTTTLPAGLALATDYFIIVVSSTVFKVATSLVNAQAGTAVDITTQGTGNHTFTPTAIAGLTGILQKSNDGTNYDDISTATSMTAGTHYWFTATDPEYCYFKFKLAITAGSATVTNNIIVKGEN